MKRKMRSSFSLASLLLLSSLILCLSESPCSTEDIGNCPLFSVCKLKNGVPYCDCLPGFISVGGVCLDIDECLTGGANCYSPAVCVNTPGSYVCSCPSGYFGSGAFCSDLNECTQASTSVCDPRQGVGTCSNTIGSYSCSCAPGFKLAPNLKSCIDINECTEGTHGCGGVCTNTEGSFQCSCQPGMSLQADGKSCQPSISCISDKQCSYQCSSINGVDTCLCQNGFKMDSSENCIDIDECTASSPCDPVLGICLNTPGSFLCLCKDGYISGPDNSCRDRDGGWSVWTQWLQCNRSCNGGFKMRFRFCDNPSPAGLGSACSGAPDETQICNTNSCPLTEDEKNFGFGFFVDGLTNEEFSKIESVLLSNLAKSMNDYCMGSNANLRKCCSTTTNFIPNANTTEALLDWKSVVVANGYPRIISERLLKMLVIFKFSKNNVLCGTASRRKKRAVLDPSDSALNPNTIDTAITDRQFYLAQRALEDSILAAFNQTRDVKVYKDEGYKFPLWAIIVLGILACLLFLLLLILLIWCICKRCCKKQNRIGSSRDDKNTSRNKEEIMMRERERKRKEEERRKEKEDKKREKERRRREKEEERERRENLSEEERRRREEERRRREEEERRRREEEERRRRERESDSGRSRDQTSAGRNRGDQRVAEEGVSYRPPVMMDFDEDLDDSTPRPTNRFNIPPKVNPINVRNSRVDVDEYRRD